MSLQDFPHQPQRVARPSKPWFVRWILWGIGLGSAAGLSLLLVIGIAMSVAFPNLPDVSALSDYHPKLPLRVYTADNVLIGEFGEERRQMTPIGEIPKVMINAVLAIEDTQFYEHGGVDYKGMLRAALANLGQLKSQGASTITMQVARNVYLSFEKTYTRKIYEILLTYKLEHLLSKDQILEIYMNQIFLGNRAYGFAAAAQAYFGVELKNITLAQAAMLAGLPKAPSVYNPLVNPKRARSRQMHILNRMLENGFITAAQEEQAKQETLKIKAANNREVQAPAEYASEMVRQLMYAQYGEEIYTRGLNVYTTLNAKQQNAAYAALRRGIMNYESRQVYRGPEGFVPLPEDPQKLEDVIDDALERHPDNGDIMSAVVLAVENRKIKATRQNGETFEISGSGLKPAQSGLAPHAPAGIRIRPGAVIRVMKTNSQTWQITQLPEVEGAFVAMNPRNGAIQALVGGFDFNKSKFNRVTQAWRQPGSSFKPFIYSAALENGLSPATIINDERLFFDADMTGSQPWEPKNYDGKFDGPMTMQQGLAKSKNMVSIRILQAVGTQNAQNWITRFGFDESKHPPYLTMALGSGSVTPLQMVRAYSVFANGGYRPNPWLITQVTDQQGKILANVNAPIINESWRVVSARNAFVMDSMLQEVTRSGTASNAQAQLKRPDLYGKTGTTNESMDAWFAGFQPTLAAVVWVGYDNTRKLGDHETGGGLSLPIWIEFMGKALKNVPISTLSAPSNVVNVEGKWLYEEYANGAGVMSLATNPLDNDAKKGVLLPSATEKRQILDLFKSTSPNQ